MSINKINVSGTSYDISPSPTGTLKNVTSYDVDDSDVSGSTTYIQTPTVTTNNTNGEIFSIVTKMLANIRFLYYKLMHLDPGASTLNGETTNLNVSNAVGYHTHSTSDLPVNSQQVNSSSYIPTSSLIYSMNEALNNVSDNLLLDTSVTTNLVCGGVQQTTTFASGTNIKNILIQMLKRNFEAFQDAKIDEWNSTSDVDRFFTQHTPENGWAGLKLGNYVLINDGTYNLKWGIQGFDCEFNKTAATGQSYNNGRGIMMRPYNNLIYESSGVAWNTSNSVSGGYASSNMNTVCNSTVYKALKTVCGSHIKSRTVYLSNAVGSNNRSSSVKALSRYLVLPTRRQLGVVETRYPPSDYDIGEANYKLPVYIYTTSTEDVPARYTNYFQWTREISTGNSSSGSMSVVAITPKDYANSYVATSFLVTRTSYSYTSSTSGSSVTKNFAIGPTMYMR